jgi:hypothetical protein
LIAGSVTPIRDPVAVIGDQVSLVRGPVPLVCGAAPLVTSTRAHRVSLPSFEATVGEVSVARLRLAVTLW